jgi:DNA-binding transcriptional regulator YbjK
MIGPLTNASMKSLELAVAQRDDIAGLRARLSDAVNERDTLRVQLADQTAALTAAQDEIDRIEDLNAQAILAGRMLHLAAELMKGEREQAVARADALEMDLAVARHAQMDVTVKKSRAKKPRDKKSKAKA